MASLPRITVVTPSYNQGKFIGRTIESVLAQNYPNLEHIVVDGMSTDETPAVLAQYPHLRALREPDCGQADAINKGFRHATGDIYCFLNSDDTLLPGALQRVAREIDPARGRHLVVGRCIHVDEDDRPTGMEHPSAPVSPARLLQVWNVHCVPQPATFWTAEAWRHCGPMDESEQLVLDYDLMCRFSRRYRFHAIDQVLATYRLHTRSKSCSTKPGDIYDRATVVSRRYWGPRWRARYWRALLSLALFRLERRCGRRQRAAQLTAAGHQALAAGLRWRSLVCRARAALLAPEAACRRWLLFGAGPLLRRWLPRAPTSALTWRSRRLPPVASAWRSFTGQHPDGHVGPVFTTTIHTRPGASLLQLDGVVTFPGPLPQPLIVDVALDGQPVARGRITTPGPFSLSVSAEGLASGAHELAVTSSWFAVSDDFWGNADFRPLSFLLRGIRWSGEAHAADAYRRTAGGP